MDILKLWVFCEDETFSGHIRLRTPLNTWLNILRMNSIEAQNWPSRSPRLSRGGKYSNLDGGISTPHFARHNYGITCSTIVSLFLFYYPRTHKAGNRLLRPQNRLNHVTHSSSTLER